MANKKFWLGILVMVLVFGMMVLGCEVTEYENSATLYVKNTSSITYWVSDKNNDKGVTGWTSLQPDKETFFLTFWNDGDASGGEITIYYQSEGTSATYWTPRTYYLKKSEKRRVEIP